MVQGTPTACWGKLERGCDGEVISWHPLRHHCADVAATFEALLAQPVVAARLSALAATDILHPTTRARLAALAFLHDIGKCNSGFQAKAQPAGARTPVAGHVEEVRALFCVSALSASCADALPLAAMQAWGEDAAVDLLCAAIAHHGRPFDPERGAYGASFWQRCADGYDPFAALADLGRAVQRWFPAAFKEGPALPRSAAFQHAFAGFVMLADWLGSDTRHFAYSDSAAGNRMPEARRCAREAVRAVGIDVAAARTSISTRPPTFAGAFGFEVPRHIQSSAAEDLDQRLVVLEAETGSGKTEAALWRFLRLFERGQVDGMYFALPTRAAATQMHARVAGMAERIWPDHRPPVVLAIPGYFRVDDSEGFRLPGFQVQWNDDPKDGAAHRRWASEHPKRYLAAPIAVGTVDQALLGALRVRHAPMRSAALLRQFLVVDEVHASDTYMHGLLQGLLDNHLAAGGHALLMSATLGASVRSRYLRGRSRGEPLNLDEALNVPYPAISTTSAGSRPVEGRSRSKHISVEIAGMMDAPGAVAELAFQAATAGAKVLVVRNTVGAAIETQRALEVAAGSDAPALFRCQGTATLHHGRFAPQDRRLLDSAVEAALGRTRPEGGLVVVGTQTLEQSLDIDADLLLTDICPMDVLLQRAGRLHRHERLRPERFALPRLVVLTPAQRDLSALLRHGRHGLGSVYPDLRMIEATWRLLEAQPMVEIPAMNRSLVERAVHPNVLEQIGTEGGRDWTAHGLELAGRDFAHSAQARTALADWGTPYRKVRYADLEEHLKTRLGADDRLAIFGDDAPAGPFGRSVASLALPAHLCRDLQDDAAVTAVSPQEGGEFDFMFGGRGFHYGRLGLAASHTPR